MSVAGISNMRASLFHGPDDTVSRLEFLFHEPLQFIERVAAVDFPPARSAPFKYPAPAWASRRVCRSRAPDRAGTDDTETSRTPCGRGSACRAAGRGSARVGACSDGCCIAGSNRGSNRSAPSSRRRARRRPAPPPFRRTLRSSPRHEAETLVRPSRIPGHVQPCSWATSCEMRPPCGWPQSELLRSLVILRLTFVPWVQTNVTLITVLLLRLQFGSYQPLEIPQ